MNIARKSKKSPHKKAALITACGIVVVAGLCSGIYLYHQRNSKGISTAPDLPVNQNDNRVTDKNQPITDSPNSNPTKTLSPSTEDPSTTSSGIEKPVIIRAEQSGTYVRVSATLTQPSSGTCVLTLTKGDVSITRTAAIIVGPSYYTCDGFRITTSDLESTGVWTATVTHKTDQGSATSDSIDLTVN